MPTVRRRDLLVLGLTGFVAPAGLRAGGEEPGALRPADWEAIRWGEPVDGLQAGLRITKPRASYRLRDHAELAVYLRNRTDAPVRLTCDPAFAEQTPTARDAAGKIVPVWGYGLAGLPTVLLQTLPPGETLVLDHPGLWFWASPTRDAPHPHLLDAKPGRYRISQRVSFSRSGGGREPLRDRGSAVTHPAVFLSRSGQARRGESLVLAMRSEDTRRSLWTGTAVLELVRQAR